MGKLKNDPLVQKDNTKYNKTKSKKKVWDKNDPNKPLTPKEKTFVRKYLTNGFIAGKAIVSAKINIKYTKKSAYEMGSRLLKKGNIKKAIEEAFKDGGLIVQKSMEEIAKIAYSDIAHFITIDDLTGVVKIKPLNDIDEGMTTVIHSIEEDRYIKEDPSDPKGEALLINSKFKFKLHDKLKANELILKMAGKFIDKVDITSGGEPLEPTTFVFLGKDDKQPEDKE